MQAKPRLARVPARRMKRPLPCAGSWPGTGAAFKPCAGSRVGRSGEQGGGWSSAEPCRPCPAARPQGRKPSPPLNRRTATGPILLTTEQHQYDNDDQDDPDGPDAAMAIAVAISANLPLKPPSRKMIGRTVRIVPRGMMFSAMSKRAGGVPPVGKLATRQEGGREDRNDRGIGGPGRRGVRAFLRVRHTGAGPA